MKKNDSYEEKNDSWLHHFAFLIPLFIILGIVICFGFVEPDYLEEGEVSITFFKPLKPMENAGPTDVFRLGIEIPYYDEEGHRLMDEDVCYLYFTKNGEPCKEGKYEDWAAAFTLQGIHDEVPQYNRLHFYCLENTFYEMEKDEFVQVFGLRGEYSKSEW